MTNPYYSPTGNPASATLGRATNIRAEFSAIEGGFDAVNVALLTPTFTGNATVSKASPAYLLNATASGQTAEVRYLTDFYNRWQVNKTSDSELGANTGSHFEINRYSDAGGYLGTIFYAFRTTGTVLIGTRTAVSGGAKLQTVDGLSFPATAVLSSNATTLDEYRENGAALAWTPVDASSDGLTFSGTSTQHVKVGCMVFVQFQITFPATAGTQPCQIAGMPFGQRASVTRASLAVGLCAAGFAVNAYVRGSGASPSTYIQLNKMDGSSVINSEMSGRTIFASGWFMTD